MLVQESSFQYWPAVVGQLTEFGEYTVDMISEEALTGFTIRTLSVLHKKVSTYSYRTGILISQTRTTLECMSIEGHNSVALL